MKMLSRFLALAMAAGAAYAQPALRLKGVKRDRSLSARFSGSVRKSRTIGRSPLVVQFADNPRDDQLTELQNRSAVLLSYVPDFALSISANDNTPFDGLDLKWVGQMQPNEKISPELDEILMNGRAISVLAEFYGDV